MQGAVQSMHAPACAPLGCRCHACRARPHGTKGSESRRRCLVRASWFPFLQTGAPGWGVAITRDSSRSDARARPRSDGQNTKPRAAQDRARRARTSAAGAHGRGPRRRPWPRQGPASPPVQRAAAAALRRRARGRGGKGETGHGDGGERETQGARAGPQSTAEERKREWGQRETARGEAETREREGRAAARAQRRTARAPPRTRGRRRGRTPDAGPLAPPPPRTGRSTSLIHLSYKVMYTRNAPGRAPRAR